MAVKIRKPVPLSPVEVELLTRLRTAGSWQHETLRRVAGDDAVTSEASTLHALVDLGFQRLSDLALELGYDTIAHEHDGEDDAYEAALRRRRTAPTT